jgi:anaerobic selenocysteine-containing dehydrogenase
MEIITGVERPRRWSLEEKAFVMLGGNFARAIPDQGRTNKAWRKMRLTVNIATKLNRTHLLSATSCRSSGGS